MERKIYVEILSPLDMLEESRWPAIVDLLTSIYPDIAPERYGTHEPLREVFDPAHPNEFIRLMSYHIDWKRRSPRVEGSWSPGVRHRSLHAAIDIDIDAAKADAGKLIEFLLATSVHMHADFAYMHQLVEQDVPTMKAAGAVHILDPKKETYLLVVTTHDLRRFIPDIYWGTVFGPPYVEMFGRERLLSTPAPIVRELEGGGVYLQLSDRPGDLETDFAAVDAVRRRVKAHLDNNAFFDLSAPADHIYNVPAFQLQPYGDPTSQIARAAARTEVSDPGLLNDITASADEAIRVTRERFGVELDYSPESVQKLEEILRAIYASISKRGLGAKAGRSLSDDETANLAGAWGSYIGEVFRRQFGGVWYWESDVSSKPIAGLQIGEWKLFPPVKVYKRLTQGDGDDVWFYFQAMSARIRQSNDNRGKK